MRSALILMRVQVLGLVNSLAPGMQQSTDRGKRVRRLALAAMGFMLFAALSAGYLFLTGIGLTTMGLASAIPALATLAGSIMGIVFAFTKTRGVLFGLRDFDHVMSLPISRRTIVATRLATLYGSAIVLAIIVMTPLYVAYFLDMPLSAGSIAAAALSPLLAPLIPVSLAIFAAFGITAVSARFRHANAAFIVLAMLLILGIVVVAYSFSFNLNTSSDDAALAMLGDLASSIDRGVCAIWPPAAWAASAVATGSLPPFALFVGASIAVPAFALEVIQRNYLALTSALAGGRASRRRASRRSGPAERAALDGASTSSPFIALAMKEVRTIVGIPAYAINCLFGYLFMVVIAGAIAIVGLQPLLGSGVIDGVQLTASEFNRAISIIMLLVPWAFTFCAAMSPTAACSVSLEGRSSWIMATAPLPARTILGAKLAVNALPVAALLAVCALICALSGQLNPLAACEVVLLGFGVFYFMVNVGLAIDAARPNFSWTSPNEVVKRGMPVMVCVLGGMVVMFGGIVGVLGLSYAVGPFAGHVLNIALGVAGALGGHAVFCRTCRHAETALFGQR